jgi:hypothetical protein
MFTYTFDQHRCTKTSPLLHCVTHLHRCTVVLRPMRRGPRNSFLLFRLHHARHTPPPRALPDLRVRTRTRTYLPHAALSWTLRP